MTVTNIDASADSYLDEQNAASNFGDRTEVLVGWQLLKSSQAFRGILKFPFDEIPDTDVITAANLMLPWFVGAATAQPAEIVNVIGQGIGIPGWVKEEVSWNVVRTGVPWVSPGGDFDSVGKVDFNLPTVGVAENYDVLSLVLVQRNIRGQNNLNILLRRTVEVLASSFAQFRSIEAAEPPAQLTLTHERAPGIDLPLLGVG